MGTGISGAVPLSFKLRERFHYNEKDFTKGFFDNYDVTETSGKKLYTIKSDLLLNNYKAFLAEFYDLIEVDFQNRTGIAPDAIPGANTVEEFMEVFSGDNRNNCVPFMYETPSMFSTLGCECEDYWLFYSGSYKAYLEVYSTLNHMEKMVSKAVKNPLANAVKFGIFG